MMRVTTDQGNQSDQGDQVDQGDQSARKKSVGVVPQLFKIKEKGDLLWCFVISSLFWRPRKILTSDGSGETPSIS